jgi:hypothetical protein
MLITYIIKMKRAKPVKWICPYKNDITNNLEPQKSVIYSRYLQSGFVTGLLEKSKLLEQVKSVWLPIRITTRLFSAFLSISQIDNV